MNQGYQRTKGSKGRVALVLGYDNYGGVARFCDLFHQYGFDEVVALVNEPELLNPLKGKLGLRLVKVDDPLDPDQLFSAAKANGAEDTATPFLCIQDRPMFSYVVTWQRLCAEAERPFHVPVDGIIRGRLKPCAREYWNRAGVDQTKWTIRGAGSRATAEWGAIGGLARVENDEKYVVKPVCGMASEAVRVCRGRDLDQCVSEVQSFLKKQQFYHDPRSKAGTVTHQIGDREARYSLYSDVLVEELLEGNEYTVDGYIANGEVSIAVQQKESRVVEPFFGDGLIMSPPDRNTWQRGGNAEHSIVHASLCHTSMSEFEQFLLRGLRALNLDNWVFHAEVMETLQGLRFVELNPRPAGGLLWLTAGLHLGLDPFEVVLRMHLNHSTLSTRRNWVTGQFPIYAKRSGKISAVKGIERAREIPGVERVDQILHPGKIIASLARENYVAFVCIHAPTHDEVRRIAAEVEKLIEIEW